MLEPGQIVLIYGLQSAKGKELNNSRAIVLRVVTDVEPLRYEVVVEESTHPGRPNVTSSVKESNLRAEPKRPLPPQRGDYQRGCVTDVNSDMARTLTELLVRYTDDYKPSETMLLGYASMAFTRLGQFNYMAFTSVQMEQVAGLVALANICDQGGVSACESTLFALLEGDPMCLDVISILLFHTPFIGPEEEVEKRDRVFDRTPQDSLTPDQDSDAYCNFMKAGPILLLTEMSKWRFGSALFASIRKRSEFYPQVVHRILRIIAREGMSNLTNDGKRLGKMCRKFFPSLIGDGVLSAEVEKKLVTCPVSNAVATKLLLPSMETKDILSSLPQLLDVNA